MLTKFGSYLNEKLPIGERLNETIINPNFSVVVPGGCNGKCSFCFWKQSKVCENYIGNLLETLDNMPSQFYQLSLTGGEPTLSPYLERILESIDRNRWTHTVLTSNGTNILKYIPKLKGKIDHINISRHHYDDTINESIFGTDTVPDSKKLKTIVKELNKVGIDVTYSAVLTEELNSKEGAKKYIEFAKESGAKQVFLRKPHGSLAPSEAEKAFEHLPSNTHSCPVCRNTTQKINGITVVWKASLEEPSKELGMIYEVIHHEDGTLTSDWEQNLKINPTLIKENANSEFKWEDGVFECGVTGNMGCGGNSRKRRKSTIGGCGVGTKWNCGGDDDEDDDAEEKRIALLNKRKKKIGKIENKIKEKTVDKDKKDFYGSGWISTFDSFEYRSKDAVYECGGGSPMDNCGGEEKPKKKRTSIKEKKNRKKEEIYAAKEKIKNQKVIEDTISRDKKVQEYEEKRGNYGDSHTSRNLTSFENFEYKGSQAIYECGGGSTSSCGGGSSDEESYSGCGGSVSGCGGGSSSKKKKKKLYACNGGQVAGCGGDSNLDDEESIHTRYIGCSNLTEEELEELERRELLFHRKEIINRIKRDLKEREENTEGPSEEEKEIVMDNLLKNLKKAEKKIKASKSSPKDRKNFYGGNFVSSFTDFRKEDDEEDDEEI